MKKIIIFTLIFANTQQYIMSMEEGTQPTRRRSVEKLKQLSPLSKKKPLLSNPYDNVLKDAMNAKDLPNLLLVFHDASMNHNMTAREIGEYALSQPKLTDDHKFLYLKMMRIAQYHKQINAGNKFCPVLNLHNSFDTVMSIYKLYREARIKSNNCGLPISVNQQHLASLYAPKVSVEIAKKIPSLAFEEYIDMDIDLSEIKFSSFYWDYMIEMLRAQQSDATPTIRAITLDGNY